MVCLLFADLLLTLLLTSGLSIGILYLIFSLPKYEASIADYIAEFPSYGASWRACSSMSFNSLSIPLVLFFSMLEPLAF
jgi:hypothetical protein